MSRSSWIATGVVALTLGATVVAGAQIDPPSEAASLPDVVQAPLSGSVLVCPGPIGVPDGEASVAAVALPGVLDDADGGTGVATDTDDVLLIEPLDSAEVAGEPLASTEERGTTLTAPVPGAAADDDDEAEADTDADGDADVAADAADADDGVLPAVAVRGAGTLAPAVTAESTMTARSVRSSGLAGAPCVEPTRDLWFVAGSGVVGERATLVLGNPADGPALVDIEVWDEDGPLPAAGTQDLGIPPGGTRTLALDAVAAGSERIAVHVRAELGRVGGAVALRQVDGADPIGLTWVVPSREPATTSFVPGLPAFGERQVRLLNPSETDAIVSMRVLAGRGPFTPVGLDAIDVPAGQVVDVSLSEAGDEAFTLEIASTEPLVAAALLRQTPDSGIGDLAVVASAGTLDTAAASRVSTADSRSSRIVLGALPDPDSPGGGDVGGTDDATAEPSPPSEAAPTDGASPDASPDAGSDASSDASPDADPGESPPPTPGESPAGSPDANPNATAEATATEDAGDFIEVETPTTEVTVRLVGFDGEVLDTNVATIALGTTDVFPIDLPDGVDDAWVVVEPSEPGLVMATRETTTTVSVPDPLDPEAERDAFWLDLVALTPTRVTVDVPPVLPDLTVSLPRR